MKITLKVMRQTGPSAEPRLVQYELMGISGDMSFLEMLDVLNEELTERGEDPVRLRLGLPRGHLRHVRHRHRR